MNLLSESLKNMFEQKISTEIYNSNIYLKIYNYLSVLGLSTIAEYFHKQSLDEIGHRDKFMGFANDRNCSIEMMPVESINIEINNLKDIGNLYLQRELETTKYIKDMVFLAWEEEDLIAYNFLISMILEQQEEEKSALDFQDIVNNIGDNPSDWQLLNNTFSL